MSNLFEQHWSYPLLEAYADNPVQICPRHATHDIIPTTKKEVCVPFSKVPRHNINAALRHNQYI
jgi:hypothetical protein